MHVVLVQISTMFAMTVALDICIYTDLFFSNVS